MHFWWLVWSVVRMQSQRYWVLDPSQFLPTNWKNTFFVSMDVGNCYQPALRNPQLPSASKDYCEASDYTIPELKPLDTTSVEGPKETTNANPETPGKQRWRPQKPQQQQRATERWQNGRDLAESLFGARPMRCLSTFFLKVWLAKKHQKTMPLNPPGLKLHVFVLDELLN